MSATSNIKETAHKLIDSLLDEDVSWRNIFEVFKNQLAHDDPLWLETEKALADLDAGRLVGGEQVMQWIDSWGQENEKTPPSAG